MSSNRDASALPRAGAESSQHDEPSSPPDDPAPDVEQPMLKAITEERHSEALLLCARAHGAAIGRLCMAMLGSQEEAEEVAQETLLAAYQGFSDYRAEGKLRAWLFGIARKKCLKQLALRRRREVKLMLIKEGSAEPDVEELMLARENAQRARLALSEVRPTEREALLLRYQAGLSFEEVAAACEIEPAAARKRVSRGLLRLRSVLSDQESQEEEGAS